MNITFVEDCPPVSQTGWSAYKKGDQATLKNGAHLVAVGIAREGWITMPPADPMVSISLEMLKEYTMQELRSSATERGLSISKKNKKQLIDAILADFMGK